MLAEAPSGVASLVFGPAIVGYLFLGGLGGGLGLVCAFASLSVPRSCANERSLSEHRRLLPAGFALACVALVLGSLLLLAGVGNPAALKYLFLAEKWKYLNLGAWALAVGIALNLMAALAWKTLLPARSWAADRVLMAFAAAVNFAVLMYVGLMLSGLEAVPFWNSPWVPLLFATSGLSCGLVMFAALDRIAGTERAFVPFTRFLLKLDLIALALEALSAAALIADALLGAEGVLGQAAVASAWRLLSGDLLLVWWFGFAGLGLALVAVFDILIIRSNGAALKQPGQVLASIVCVCGGALALRYCVMMAGVHPVVMY